MCPSGLPLVREKSGKFQVREKSGNFIKSQWKFEIWKKSVKFDWSQGNLMLFVWCETIEWLKLSLQYYAHSTGLWLGCSFSIGLYPMSITEIVGPDCSSRWGTSDCINIFCQRCCLGSWDSMVNQNSSWALFLQLLWKDRPLVCPNVPWLPDCQ